MYTKNLVKTCIVVGIVFSWVGGCVEQSDQTEPEFPAQNLKGVLIDEIPASMDIIFTSIRYVLHDRACLDEDGRVKPNFIHDPDCSKEIYDPNVGFSSPRQLFALDLETGEVIQITNMDWFFVSGQVVDTVTLMVNAATSDTTGDGIINDRDLTHLYFLDLISGEMDCLTCSSQLEAINNPDYSNVIRKIVFSARKGSAVNLNHLFTVDREKNLVQLTDNRDYMDFDCSWSEDGTKIAFSRLPSPWFEAPSQIWIMDSNGENLEKITDGGGNPDNEGPHGVYPIGIDADPDFSPDSTKIVFSRLKTGKENQPFGIYQLIIVDILTKQETILDTSHANMVPEWKEKGILFIRQTGAADPMDRKQRLYLLRDGEFCELEKFPYNVFPIGAYGGSWIL